MIKSSKVMAGLALSAFLFTFGQAAMAQVHTVKAGESLWTISRKYGIDIESLKKLNNLKNDKLRIGQKLKVEVVTPSRGKTMQKSDQESGKETENKSDEKTEQSVNEYSKDTYAVQPGDTVESIAKKLGVSADDILKYNYMNPEDKLISGQTISISDYAPKTDSEKQEKDSEPKRVGKLVDWFKEGKNIFKTGDKFIVTDVETEKQFNATMIGGGNHCDMEPLTAEDTEVMKELFSSGWTWTPRPVVVFKDGMNIAASLSGQPHGFDTVKDNNVDGMFDMYLLNSKSHGSNVSESYKKEHYNAVLKAAGQ